MPEASDCLTPEQEAERQDAAVVCPRCHRPTVLVVAQALWQIDQWGEGDWCLGRLWAGEPVRYPISKTDRATCNSSSCDWTGPLSEVEVRRPWTGA